MNRYIAKYIGLCFFPLLAGCAPYIYSYDHVVFREADDLVVLERSVESTDSQGNKLYFSKLNLALHSRLETDYYLVEIKMTLSGHVFLKVEGLDGVPLKVLGNHLINLAPNAIFRDEGYRYSFLATQADESPMNLRVFATDGSEFPSISLEYRVVSRGYTVGFDSL